MRAEQNSSANQARPWRSFLDGFYSSPLLLYFFVVLPWTVYQLFEIGLNDVSLIIVACAIPGAFSTLFLVLLPGAARVAVHFSASIVAGTLALLVGMLFAIGFDDSSFPSSVALAAYLIAGFVAAYLSVLGKNAPRLEEAPEGHAPRMLVHGCGLVAPVLLTGWLVQATTLGAFVFFIAAFVHVAALLGRVVSRGSIEHGREGAGDHKVENRSRMPRHHAANLETAMLLLLVLPAAFMFSSLAHGLAAGSAASGYEFLALGVLVSFAGYRHAWVGRLSVPWVLFGLFAAFMVLETTTGVELGIRAAGLAAGLVAGELTLKATSLPRSPRRSSEGLVLFFALLLIVLGAGLGSEYQSIVGDEEAYVWIPVAFILVAGSVVASLTVVERVALRNKASDVLLAECTATRVAAHPSPSQRRRLAAMLAIALVGIPLFGVSIGMTANIQVRVVLGTTMYDVYDNPVDVVDLRPGTAMILLSSPSPVGTPHGELIRPGKSVRIGGYYYGYQNSTDKPFTRDQVVQWVGESNDVFSFGFMGTSGDSMTPDNITAIKAINSQARFYYMAFATTLFEDAGSPGGTGPAWGNQHYPHVQFNTTISNMTLKLANGSEAIGVRRTSNADTAHLMDLGNTAWADYFAWIYENRSKQFHANGVAIDEVMWQGYWDVNKKNGGVPLRDYTTEVQIRASCYDWLERIDAMMEVEIITQAFWPEAQVHQQGVWGEIAFRAGGPYGDRVDDRPASVWYDLAPMNWAEIVGNMHDLASLNKSYIWAAWYEPGDMEGLEYSIATYLMGKPNNCTWLVFQPHPGYYPDQNLVGYAARTVKDEVEAHSELFDVELGDALGYMELRDGIGGHYYQRTFQNGIVLANPFHARLPGF
ncbi:MAG: hypothetical protein JW839_21670 [Candidatus Lokiarchaeota archaeon]|nr:hypothetical protein [Candidatus Lokiarchaeota archaeon]